MKYGCGLTMEDFFRLDRERIIKALQGKLVYDETEEGFEYGKAPKKDCKDFILSAFDNACHLAIQGNNVGRMLEQMLKEKGMSGKSFSMNI